MSTKTALVPVSLKAQKQREEDPNRKYAFTVRSYMPGVDVCF